MIRTIIIDDEPLLREINQNILEENFKNIKIVGTAGSVKEGIKLIEKEKPDIVLLDIELQDGNGFDILNKVKPHDFVIIFITAHNEFAIKAIKFSAIDYILKPVNEFELCSAIERAIERNEFTTSKKQVDTFIEHISPSLQNEKIVLRTTEAINIVDLQDIKYCKSDNSYTTFHLEDNLKIITSKGLKEYEEMLNEKQFFRPHNSYLVNLHKIKKIDKSDGGAIILKDNSEIPVSTRRKTLLLQKIAEL